MIEFIIILLVSIGLSVSEAGSTVLGGQVYDEVGECHTAGTRFKTPCKNKKPAENLLGGNRYDENGNCFMAGVRGDIPCVKLTPISTLIPPASNCDISKAPCDKTPMIY
jgi:hypothetical protein